MSIIFILAGLIILDYPVGQAACVIRYKKMHGPLPDDYQPIHSSHIWMLIFGLSSIGIGVYSIIQQLTG
jgi:hypothetical protein